MLVTLQDEGARELARRLRRKVRTGLSVRATSRQRARPPRGKFRVCVLGHLRDEKDPVPRGARPAAPAHAPSLEVLHVGEGLAPGMARTAVH